MDLLALGGDYHPDYLVENKDSLIWTERYRNAGDFELKTADITKTRNRLFLGSLVAIRESTEMMMVETHEIAKDPNTGEAMLTVKGRSFETFLENRVARPNGDEELYVLATDKSKDWKPFPAGATAGTYAEHIITHKCLDSPLYGQNIPDLIVSAHANTNNTVGGKPFRKIAIKLGTVYERVLDLLNMDNIGIRSIRPASGFVPSLTIHIYDGEDKTNTVQLSVSAGHFTKTSYLWSIKDHKEMGWGFSYYWFTVPPGGGMSGLMRRIGIVDATDIKSDSPSTTDPDILENRVATFLKQRRKVSIFDGEVSSEIPYKYGTDYYLGDMVKIIGDYGVRANVQVTEYIRIEDDNGERAYPTLGEP